jgi:hypothetical protein
LFNYQSWFRCCSSRVGFTPRRRFTISRFLAPNVLILGPWAKAFAVLIATMDHFDTERGSMSSRYFSVPNKILRFPVTSISPQRCESAKRILDVEDALPTTRLEHLVGHDCLDRTISTKGLIKLLGLSTVQGTHMIL